MKKIILLVITCIALALVAVSAANASRTPSWFVHSNGSGKLVCDAGAANANIFLTLILGGPFSSKAACDAALPSNGGGDDATPTGQPGTTGTISGEASGNCGAPVILTSGEDAPGYGAFDYDITPGQTFSQIGLDFDFDVLSGTQAQSEPYLIVRFTDGTQAFVYSVDVNPGEAGQQVFSLTGNTYITRAEAMEQAGDKIVSSVTLAVDNGNLSIQANGLSVDGACAAVSTYVPPTETWLCYSAFQTTPGDWPSIQAVDLIAAGYTEAQAVARNVEGGVNVGAYHLVCNSGLTVTGESVGDGGSVFGSDYGPAHEELGFYAIYA